MALSFWDNGFSLHQEMFSFQTPEPENNDLELDSYFNLFSSRNNDNGFGFDYDYVSDTFSDHQYFPSVEDFELYENHPKRQNGFYYGDGVVFSPEFFSGCVSNVVPPPRAPPVPEFFPDIPAPPLAGFSFGKSSSTKKLNGGSLKAQSSAARERRRKITEKTQELGKLVPGGHRMNTAEMFQAASEYVKFLQAQFNLLQLMEPLILPSQELQTLVQSPVIQEKLYSEEKCLVPREILQTLKKDPEIQSKAAISWSIDELLETSNG